MDVDYLLNFIVASQEYTRPVMDVLRHYLQHSLHMAVDRLTASCAFTSVSIILSGSRTETLHLDRVRTILEHHCHRCTLVQDAELSFRTLFVSRVCKYAAVQQSSVCICHHGPNVSCAVGFAVLSRLLEAVDVFLDRIFPVETVSLID